MALNIESPALAAQPAPVAAQPYDVLEDRDRTVAELADSGEIDRLTSQIDVNDMTSIVTFGAGAAEALSKASDAVLHSMDPGRMDETGQLLEALAKVMKQFNIDELKDGPGPSAHMERILAKYNAMGDQVDGICGQLKDCEDELKRSNQMLEQMFQSNVGYFHELEKYIVAGEQGCREIEDYMARRQAEYQRTGDQAIAFELHTLEQAGAMLRQRTQDLRTAEAVALQSIPMIKAMQYNNMNLARVINSAFIVTLPVFRQALAQNLLLKRQKLQSDALAALDQRTNALLQKNARNATAQARALAAQAAEPSIQAGTLAKTWQTIVGGIEETRRLQASAREQRQQDRLRLESVRRDFMQKYNLPQDR